MSAGLSVALHGLDAIGVVYGILGLLLFGVTMEDEHGSTDVGRVILAFLMSAVWPVTLVVAFGYYLGRKVRNP